MGALKYDGDKPPLAWIPRSYLSGIARVLAYGATKYDRDNWRKGMEWMRLASAAMRHLGAWVEGEDRDPETGESHLYHAACCLLFLSWYQETSAGTDDRWTTIRDKDQQQKG